MDWKKLVGSVAPTLATALGGPLAGMAVSAIGNALGLEGATEDKIEAALQSAKPELLLQLKQADQDFAKQMKALDIDLEKIAAADRDSARQMQVQTRARTPAILSWTIVIVTLLLEGYVMVKGLPTSAPEVISGRILGTFDTLLMTVATFWLGAAWRDPANRSKP